MNKEKYVPLSYKYILCDQEYKLCVINKILCNVEYQDDGSTATMWLQYKKNPRGFAALRKLDMLYPNSYRKLLIATVHYVSSSLIGNNKKFIQESPRKLLTIFLLPFGVALSKYTLYKADRLEIRKLS